MFDVVTNSHFHSVWIAYEKVNDSFCLGGESCTVCCYYLVCRPGEMTAKEQENAKLVANENKHNLCDTVIYPFLWCRPW